MRGFGCPQIHFAAEAQMDIFAERVNLSPLDIRLLNCLKPMDRTATGQVLKQSVGFKDTLLSVKKRLSAQAPEKSEEENKRRGIGWGCMWYGIGKTGLPNPASVFLEILDDGTAILYTGCADIGQGSTVTLGQIAAEELGIDPEEVLVVTSDTHRTPDSGVTSASRTTYIVGKAVQIACREAKWLVLEQVAGRLGVEPGELAAADHLIFCTKDPKKSIPWPLAVEECKKKGLALATHGSFNPQTTPLDSASQGNPYATYAFGTQVVFVEVDRDTLKVDVKKIIAAHDVGRAVNPMNVEGQIEGGCVMGLGQALMEEVVSKEGSIITPGFSEYVVPTSMDVPEIETIIVENEEQTGPFGAKGVAEPSSIPTAAAIANAVYDAVGVRVKSFPITPDKILRELQKHGQDRKTT
jgi:CO/xanthine dehydrogenase Mo-binding subunit